MASPLDPKEARERITDRLRRNGYDKSEARKEADGSVGRVYDRLSLPNQGRRDKRPTE